MMSVLMRLLVPMLMSSVHGKSDMKSMMKSVQSTASVLQDVKNLMSHGTGCTGCTGHMCQGCCSADENMSPACHLRHNYVAYGCANGNKIGCAYDYFVLDGRHDNAVSWHCTVRDTAMTIPQGNYVVTAQFYNLHGDPLGTQTIGHIGLVFNEQDERNYDFYYIRIHANRICYVVGYMTNGSYSISHQTDCINRPEQKTWFTLRAEISGNSVTAFIDGVIAETFTAHYPRMGRAAVMIWNTYNNVAFFKDFSVFPL